MPTLKIGGRVFDCSLPFGDNDQHRCGWCGAALSGRQTRWCSKDCSWAFGKNHYWTDARAAAVKRDGGRCVRCGQSEEWPELDAWVGVLRLWCPRPPFVHFQAWLRTSPWADEPLCVDLSYSNWWEHRWSQPRPYRDRPDLDDDDPRVVAALTFRAEREQIMAPTVAAQQIVDKLWRSRVLEVNHKTPILGRHAEAGCHHHLDGLETLCHRCHLEETARQRAAGALSREDS